MISVEDGIIHVLQNSSPLPFENVSIMEACGRIVGEDIKANDPFPSFRASMMDGYAVLGDLEPGAYPVQRRIHAGDDTIKGDMLLPGNVIYITTGAMVPEGADAVVKIEDTTAIGEETRGADEKELRVEIVARVPKGAHIRQIGCDISAGHTLNLHAAVLHSNVISGCYSLRFTDDRMIKPGMRLIISYCLLLPFILCMTGETILRKGQLIGSAEVGILATVGVTSVRCYKKPVIGILSTGNELVDFCETPVGSQIRDSNRATLLTAFRQDGYTCIDLGTAQNFHISVLTASLSLFCFCFSFLLWS